jgi:hypothetical protein
MSPAQFQAALEAIGCATYDQAARVTGCGRRSLVRYGVGDLPVPTMLQRLLEMYQRHGVPKEYA